MIQKPADNITCPATMHSERCLDHFMNCPKWINIKGKLPQSEELVDRYDCADTWMPILLIENSQQQRGTQAAVESLRNVVAEPSRALANKVNNLDAPRTN